MFRFEKIGIESKLSNIIRNCINQYFTLTRGFFSFIYLAIMLTSATQNYTTPVCCSVFINDANAAAAVVPVLPVEGDTAPPREAQVQPAACAANWKECGATGYRRLFSPTVPASELEMDGQCCCLLLSQIKTPPEDRWSSLFPERKVMERPEKL